MIKELIAACSCAAFLIGCTSMNEVTTIDPGEGGLTTAEFNTISGGREGLVLLLEGKKPSKATQIEATADSGRRNRSSLGDVEHVEIVSKSDGFWEGAKWGAAVGVAVGIGLAAAEVSSAQPGTEAKTMAPLAYFIFPPIGGIIGGIAGGAYGSGAGHTYHCTFRQRWR